MSMGMRTHVMAAVIALTVLFGWAPVARAHWADLAVAEVTLAPTGAEVLLTVPTGLLARADGDRDGRLTAEEVAAHAGWLRERLAAAVRIEPDGQTARLQVAHAPLAPVPTDRAGGADAHSTLTLSYTWERATDAVAMHYGLFEPGVDTASCMATVVRDGGVSNFVFTPTQTRFELAEPGVWQQAASFVVLGFEHIVIGYDHVLFLIALLMLGGGLGYLLKVVTAFTVAHSITLALATFNVLVLPGRLVESAIALSIVYVAAETFWRKDLKGRWVVTLLFGLIHGLGFASVLKELDLAGGNLLVSLVSFNVGVEVGQVAIVLTAYMGLKAIRRQPWDLRFRQVVSAGVAAMGMVWFIERAFSA